MTTTTDHSTNGETTSISYLEFGAINPDGETKTVWDLRTGQTAYDWFMLARYANDLAAYQRMTLLLPEITLEKLTKCYACEIHHPDDFSVNLGKLLALGVVNSAQAPPSFFELGHTLFGCIEGMTFCQQLLEHLTICSPEINLRQVAWSGIDISPLFNQLAPLLHTGYHITADDNMDRLLPHYSVFFAKGVTLLYAVRSIESLFGLFDRCLLALFDYSLSLGEEQEIVLGTGKPVVYLSLGTFLSAYHASGKTIYLKRGNSRIDRDSGRVWIDGIIGNTELCQHFIACDLEIRQSLSTRLNNLEQERLLDMGQGRNSGWMTLETFLNEHGIATEMRDHGN